MAEQISTETRSRMMSRIRGRDTEIEWVVRRHLHRHGFRYRLHVKDLPGRPDIVLPKWHIAIFVHGCFWHRHKNCKLATTPKTRPEFWRAKLEGNAQRDALALVRLREMNWRTAVVWGCALGARLDSSLDALIEFIPSDQETIEISSSHPWK